MRDFSSRRNCLTGARAHAFDLTGLKRTAWGPGPQRSQTLDRGHERYQSPGRQRRVIALDTNVLVRFLVVDDPEQTECAKALLFEESSALRLVLIGEIGSFGTRQSQSAYE
jgi:hypothetical protein